MLTSGTILLFGVDIQFNSTFGLFSWTINPISTILFYLVNDYTFNNDPTYVLGGFFTIDYIFSISTFILETINYTFNYTIKWILYYLALYTILFELIMCLKNVY
jgi:hypothetical protein